MFTSKEKHTLREFIDRELDGLLKNPFVDLSSSTAKGRITYLRSLWTKVGTLRTEKEKG